METVLLINIKLETIVSPNDRCGQFTFVHGSGHLGFNPNFNSDLFYCSMLQHTKIEVSISLIFQVIQLITCTDGQMKKRVFPVSPLHSTTGDIGQLKKKKKLNPRDS